MEIFEAKIINIVGNPLLLFDTPRLGNKKHGRERV
jgi:hypothetical protein